MLYNDNKLTGDDRQAAVKRGQLVTLEGIDGTGKTTQIANLAAAIRQAGFEVIELREPGGTAIGESIREILLDKKHLGMTAQAEVLLFTAARSQLVREVIQPALEAGTWVICDRFLDSTLAYQGYGRGMDVELINSINSFAVDKIMPDRTILLDLPVEAAVERLNGRPQSPDRLDSESQAFMEKVRQGYLTIALDEPLRFSVIDAGLPENEVAEQIYSVIREGLDQ